MAEIEYFHKSTEKCHPRFKEVAGLVLSLVPAPPKDQDQKNRTTIKMSIGEAVEKVRLPLNNY